MRRMEPVCWCGNVSKPKRTVTNMTDCSRRAELAGKKCAQHQFLQRAIELWRTRSSTIAGTGDVWQFARDVV